MRGKPFTILLHLALAVMTAGAIITHYFGIQGKLTLKTDMPAVSEFKKESGPGDGRFPFFVALEKIETICYPATTTPMDFKSIIRIEDHRISVSMNSVGQYKGWRFYQSGMAQDSSTFSISHDPWGTGISYAGYVMLGIGMIGYFFQRSTPWRSLLKQYRKSTVLLLLISLASASGKAETHNIQNEVQLSAMQRPLASDFGKVLVFWNDRICPMQTLARDITATLYGKDSYKGFTSEQILSGWLFYYDEWLRDYLRFNPEIENIPSFPSNKEEKKLAERAALIQWLGTGEIFRIYPYKSVDGHTEWLSLTGRRPSQMSLEQWIFMQTSMSEIKKLLLMGKNIKADKEIFRLKEGQRKYAFGISLPSEAKIKAEIIYNKAVRPSTAGIIALASGISILFLSLVNPDALSLRRKLFRWMVRAIAFIQFLYAAGSMGLLWWISGHVPLSNGPETMMFMALVSLTGAWACSNPTMRGSMLLVAAMALFVSSMGGRVPQIGALMPVLSSPLLSLHVMIVMISYVLFFLMAIQSAIGLLTRSEELSVHLSALNRVLLTPAVFLLGAGIFIGAVWANQTWGRYWGWDPKETCALLMWLIYALPLHRGCRCLAFLRKLRTLHIYLLFAIITVIFTYFGANYLLSGLHSYA